MENLIERYIALKNRYRNYDTKHALKRMQAFRLAVQELSNKGFEVGLEILGSINFGIVEPSSDVDSIILHYCDLHQDEGYCPPDCANLRFAEQELSNFVRRRLAPEKIKIEFLDNINLKNVEKSIQDGNILDNDVLYRLLFYRSIGRPVNRPLFVKYCDRLEENQAFLDQVIPWASEALAGYLKTNQHRFSFSKYNERILSRGLDLPPGLQAELQKYLNAETE